MENSINDRYKNNYLINNPIFESNIDIIYTYVNANIHEQPCMSVVMPIYNQEEIIVDNIKSIIENTTEKLYEIILIIDCCSDNTEQLLITYISTLKSLKSTLITKILVLKSNIPLFETSADNVGFLCSNGKYILEIQADMKMTQYGYNMQLLIPFNYHNNLIGISGRCCHDFLCTYGVGKLGVLVTNNISDITNCKNTSYYIGETCNRGPLLLDKSKLIKLKYLDEVNYYLDNSDHDLFARAFYYKNWICGYVPIDFYSPLENGSTRKQRDSINQQYFFEKKTSTLNGINGFLNKYITSYLFKRQIKEYSIIQ